MSDLDLNLKVKVLPRGFIRKEHGLLHEAFQNVDSLMSYLARRINLELRLQEHDPKLGLPTSRDIRELSIEVHGVDLSKKEKP